MNKQTISIESKQPLINLALATADAMENPATSASLMDSLREVASSLIDELSGGNSAFELRALACAYTEPEKMLTASPERNDRHQARESEALAKASAIH